MNLQQSLKQLPTSPGIYQYFDKNGKLLYVGKAKNLKNRVKSYFTFTPTLHPNKRLSPRIHSMIEQTVSLNYIVVQSEHDALILENSLIKQLNPKYNILLRDDKTYPYIYIDNAQEYPRFEITRKVLKAKDITYFGPYSIGAKEVLDSIYELTKLVQKKGSLKSKKLCLYYQIEKCLGPCELNVSKERYNQEVQKGRELIENKQKLITLLEQKMELYAEQLRFEEAMELRDRIQKIQKLQIDSDIDFASGEDYDIFVIENDDSRAVVVKIFMRHGKIISSIHEFVHLHYGYDEDELYKRVLINFYKEQKPPIVAPILVGSKFQDLEVVSEHLTKVFEKKATIVVPQRGKKKKLIELAKLNAKELLSKKEQKQDLEVLTQLQELFELLRKPYRIEAFDNSHMAGEATVGAMVVWQNGSFVKEDYRVYHLDAKDEYAQMRELLLRRIESFEKNPPPDLWVLDGGATLLKLAKDLIDSAGVTLDIIAIAKEKVDNKAHRAKGKANDIIHTFSESFRLKNSDKRLQFVQNLRDEVHRSAINFHKKTKLKRDGESKLLTLNGISQAKIVKLLNHFGTFEYLKTASFEEISEVLSEKDAKIIKNYYK